MFYSKTTLKTLRICNLQENDKFCSKLAYSGLEKHTLALTDKTLAHYEVCKLQIRNIFLVVLL
jgi:hypothetical protein